MKNELRNPMFLIRKRNYAYLLGMLQSLCSDCYVNVRHLDVVSAKAGFTLSGFYPVFVLKTKATRWCPLKPTQCRSDEISVQLTNFLVIIFCLFGGIFSWSALR